MKGVFLERINPLLVKKSKLVVSSLIASIFLLNVLITLTVNMVVIVLLTVLIIFLLFVRDEIVLLVPATAVLNSHTAALINLSINLN